MKKKLGIIGGMGSPAAAWLFNRIVELSNGKKDQEYIEILLHNNTAIPDRTRAIVYKETSALPELMRSIQLFNENDVEVAVMACCTSYYYQPQLSPIFNGDLVSPVDLIVEEVRNTFPVTDGKTVGIIASTGALRSGIFHKALAPLGITVLSLEGQEQEKYFMGPIYGPGGAKSGAISEEALATFRYQVTLLQERGADMIVGSCSEVPLMLRRKDVALPYIDVFDLLAQKVIEACYAYA